VEVRARPGILPEVTSRWQTSIETGERFEMEFPLDAEWRIVRVNRRHEEVTRIARQDSLGRDQAARVVTGAGWTHAGTRAHCLRGPRGPRARLGGGRSATRRETDRSQELAIVVANLAGHRD